MNDHLHQRITFLQVIKLLHNYFLMLASFDILQPQPRRMLIHCTFSPPYQHFDKTIFIPNLIPTNVRNCPTSSQTPICYFSKKPTRRKFKAPNFSLQVFGKDSRSFPSLILSKVEADEEIRTAQGPSLFVSTVLCSSLSWSIPVQVAQASEEIPTNAVYEVAELFELGIQLSYLLLLLALLGAGSFFVIRQVLVRRELDLSAKELQEQVRSGDASATELFELGAVMLRRKIYPAATKYLRQAIEKWDGDDQDISQVHNALGVTYVRDEKLEKGIAQLETAVKIQPGYVTAWNNLGDAYEQANDLKSALKAFDEALLFDPNNKIARPRRDSLKAKLDMYRGVSVKTKKKTPNSF